MAKRDRTDALLDELAALRKSGKTDAGVTRVREMIRAGSPIVVTRAVALCDAWAASEAAPDIAGAFERLLTAQDPGCEGKQAAAKCLCEWGSPEGKPVFERGVFHVQKEAVWGGSVDVAAGLRGWSALGLAAMGHWDQVVLILPLLADPELHCRVTGARALAQGASDAAEALLRLKVIQGDVEPEVTAECISGLARAWPDRSVPFLLQLVEKGGDGARAAMIGLGESRSDDAWRELVKMYQADLSPDRRREILAALSLSRRAEPLEWICSLIENEPPGEAIAAIEALVPRRSDERVWSKVRAAVGAGGNKRIEDAFARASEVQVPRAAWPEGPRLP